MSKCCLPAFAGARCDGVEGHVEFWVAGDRRAVPADSTDATLGWWHILFSFGELEILSVKVFEIHSILITLDASSLQM